LQFFLGWLYLYITQNWKLKSAKISSAFYRFSIARMQPEFNKISPDFQYISAFEKNKFLLIAPKVVISHKEDLAKSGYKTNRIFLLKMRHLLTCW
jgi:hypothetical protein